MNILLLEDDIALNKAIEKVLDIDKHNVDTFFDGKVLLDALDSPYDLYILDINVPHISGLEILDSILLQNRDAKVIMISSNTDIYSLETAYEKGCVDYVKKPFHIAELRAKVNRLKVGNRHLYRMVSLKEPNESLTKKEKKMLNLLLENMKHLVTYEMIENHVYENKKMSMDALRTLVRRLRAKLTNNIIENIIDEGYMISHLPLNEERVDENMIQERLELLEKENQILKLEKEILLKKSTTDPLTGLYNRLKIEEIFLYEQEQFICCGDPLSMILLDLDDFKRINDKHGHNIGDKYLQKLAKTLKSAFRDTDIIGRWGGEEFIILMPKTTLAEAREIALRIQVRINDMECPRLDMQTASFGVTTLIENDTLSTFVKRADEALFRAKKAGKNRIEVYDIS